MISALIIDDEPLARMVVQEYLQDFPQIEVCRNAATALKALKPFSSTSPT
jgi:two-component system LytT family response regulator